MSINFKRTISTIFGALVLLALMQAKQSVYAETIKNVPIKPLMKIDFSRAVYGADKKSIHFAYSGDSTKPGLLFIHGTPGGWSAFKRYLQNIQLQKDFFIVSVDRIGWGQSKLDPKQIDGDFALQAKSIKAVMEQYPDKKWTLIGHSLGASIAPKVALLTPTQSQSLLLLAGSLSPKLGRPRWYNRAASTWLVSRFIGKGMRYSNREIMNLSKQLNSMDNEIKQTKLASDVIIIQGQKDRLVSPKNPAYAAEAWASNFKSIELIELQNEGHFLPWNQTQLIIDTLYRLNQ